MGIAYTPAATRWEILQVFGVAAKYQAPVHVHLRYSGLKEPETGLVAIQEVIADAAVTGAPLHVVHVTSMGLKYTPQLIAMVADAQKRGLDVTTECYPYTCSNFWRSATSSIRLIGRAAASGIARFVAVWLVRAAVS